MTFTALFYSFHICQILTCMYTLCKFQANKFTHKVIIKFMIFMKGIVQH